MEINLKTGPNVVLIETQQYEEYELTPLSEDELRGRLEEAMAEITKQDGTIINMLMVEVLRDYEKHPLHPMIEGGESSSEPRLAFFVIK